MMTFEQAVQNRHSVRDFLPEPMSRAEIEAVLNDARLAPFER